MHTYRRSQTPPHPQYSHTDKYLPALLLCPCRAWQEEEEEEEVGQGRWSFSLPPWSASDPRVPPEHPRAPAAAGTGGFGIRALPAMAPGDGPAQLPLACGTGNAEPLFPSLSHSTCLGCTAEKKDFSFNIYWEGEVCLLFRFFFFHLLIAAELLLCVFAVKMASLVCLLWKSVSWWLS